MEQLYYYLNFIDKKIFNLIIEHQIFAVIILTIIVMKLKEISKQEIKRASIIYIIGTFFHELSHYIVALLVTFKIPNKFSIFPKKVVIVDEKTKEEKTSYILGYVAVDKNKLNVLNAFPYAFAPLFLLILAYFVYTDFYLFYYKYFDESTISILIYIFLISTLIVNSIPSSKDIEVSKYKFSLHFYLIVMSIICYLLYL